MPRAIALFASSRRAGNTGQFIDRIAQELDIDVVDLAALRISPFDYEHRNRHDDFEALMRRVLVHDAIIKYLGMAFGSAGHLNCQEGHVPALHDVQAVAFASLVREVVPALAGTGTAVNSRL